MKRSLLIIPFAFVAFVLLSSIAFSSLGEVYDSTTEKIKFKLNPGWNIIPRVIMYSNNPEYPNTCEGYVRAAYTYSPVQKQYIGVYYSSSGTVYVPEDGQQILSDEADSNFYHVATIFGAMWVYTTRQCEFTTNIPSKSAYSRESVEEKTIKKGWNFITAAPFMIDHNLKDLFQFCDVLATNTWDDERQKWFHPSSTQPPLITDSDANIVEEFVGLTILVKVGEDCHLTLGDISPPMTGPPPLPD